MYGMYTNLKSVKIGCYTDVQQLSCKAMVIFSSKTCFKLRYKR